MLNREGKLVCVCFGVSYLQRGERFLLDCITLFRYRRPLGIFTLQLHVTFFCSVQKHDM